MKLHSRMSSRYRGMLKHLSIKTRLVLIILGSTLIVSGAVATVTLVNELDDLRQQKREAAQIATAVLAQDFAKITLLNSPEAAADTVSKLQAFASISAAAIVDADTHRIRFQYRRDLQAPINIPAGLTGHARFEENDAHFLLPIVYDGTTIGQAYFLMNVRDINEKFYTYIISFFFALLAILLAAFLSALFFQRIVSAPLIELSQSVRKITDNQDYEFRFKNIPQNEIGVLLRGFNAMLSRIQETTDTLHDEKERLQITLNAIDDGVITTDSGGYIVYLNPAAEQRLGALDNRLIGMHIENAMTLTDESSGQALENPVTTCMRMEKTVGPGKRAIMSNTAGKEVIIEDTSSPIHNTEGTIIGAIMIFRDVTSELHMAEQIAHQATHDALTGLLNRYVFEARLQEMVIDARRTKRQHAMIFIDLNKFNIVNYTCGYTAGDALLRQISDELLRKHVGKNDTIARLGGDEFGLLIEDCGAHKAQTLSNELIEEIKNFIFTWNDRQFNIGASFGVVQISGDSADATLLFNAANSACNAAKEEGWNRVRFYHHEDEELGRQRGDAESVSLINDALRNDRFVLYAQYIEPLSPELTRGAHYEILIRMRDDQGGLVPPNTFLPAAERYGLSPSLDRWVVENVFTWLGLNPQHVETLELCTINLSGYSIINQGFLDYVLESFTSHQIPYSKICFEVTETAAVANLERAIVFINALRAKGAKFALDDFGSGMSSFGYLKHLPVDYLKIDGSFVKNIETDSMDRAMVKSINEIAKTLGKLTIAEFVENQSVFNMLLAMGVDYAQGYHVAKPVPLESMIDYRGKNLRQVESG